MTIAWASFTPISAFLGGCLIGLAALLLMVFQGRVMGVSGIIGGLFGTTSPAERGWRLAFLLKKKVEKEFLFNPFLLLYERDLKQS